ncbi:MAG: VWA domain-containing protein [Candidatus Glassbacteria bacterium]|nr:VWA domain-containing protein [Candidatus Glassbacteria bacterium]
MADISLEFQAVRTLWLVLLPAAALVVAWWTYRRTFPPLSAGYRLLLLGLRIAVVALTGMLLFEPVVSLTRSRSRPERVAVLVDRSASMLLPAEGGGVGGDRREAALEIADGLISGLPSAGQEPALFAFGGELTAMDSLGGIFASVEDRTDLGAALEGLLSAAPGLWDRIYVISDGAVNSGADPVSVLEAAEGDPPAVEAVIVGERPALSDLALVGVERPGGRVFAGQEMELELSIAVSRPGPAGEAAPGGVVAVADIFVDGRKAAERRIVLEPGPSRFVSSRVRVEAGDPGLKLVRVVLRPLENEWCTLNNERLLFVEVSKGKREILLVSNQPDWDFTFLRQVMLSNGDWNVESLVLLRSSGTGVYVRRLDDDGVYSQGFLPGAAELQEVELVLLHGELSGYEAGFLSRLAGRAARGGFGLIFWPTGPLALSSLPGDLAAYLPFRGNLPGGFRQVPGRQQPATVFTLDRYGILDGLGAGETMDNLPPLEWVFPDAPLEVQAEVLARAGTGKRRDQALGPVLVAQPVRRARVATVLGRGLWRWHMLGQSSGEKRDTRYYRLWEELTGWLLSGERSEEFTLRPRRPVFSRGEEVVLDGALQQAAEQETAAGSTKTVRVVVRRQAEKEDTVAVAEVQPGEYRDGEAVFTVEPGRLAPGSYVYEGRVAGRVVSGRFAVESYSPELAETAPDTSLLAGLPARSGSVTLHGRDFKAPALTGEIREPEVSAFHPYTSGWVYLLIVALLAAEWTLRRRKSLA